MYSLTAQPRILPFVPLGQPKIAIVGEAPGREEIETGRPFVGAAGKELSSMLSVAGLIREDCYITNVFMTRPPENDLKAWCVKKVEANKLWPEWYVKLSEEFPDVEWPRTYIWKPIAGAGKYLHPQFFPEVIRLRRELQEVSPNLVIATGNTPCWALLDLVSISKIRGRLFPSPYGDYKVLPVYHPAAILRQYDLRTVTIADLMKAGREQDTKEISVPEVEVWIEPDRADMLAFRDRFLSRPCRVAVDIETEKGQITCIGFGVGSQALVVPFVDRRKPGYSYWQTQQDELWAWGFVQLICEDPSLEKILQNGLYDLQYLWRVMGITLANYACDTMHRHHSMQPEMPKSLDFLASVYTNFPVWKDMRPKGKEDLKGDE